MFVDVLYMVYITKRQERKMLMGNIVIELSTIGQKEIPHSTFESDGPRLIIEGRTFFLKAYADKKIWITWFQKDEASELWFLLDHLTKNDIKFNISYLAKEV